MLNVLKELLQNRLHSLETEASWQTHSNGIFHIKLSFQINEVKRIFVAS